MNSKIIKITAFIFLVIPMICQAEIIKIGFTGKVDSIFDPYNVLENTIHQNQSITGFYIYDSATLDSDPSPMFGVYQYNISPYGMSLTIGDLTFLTDPLFVNSELVLVNNYGGGPHDTYGITSHNNLPINNDLSIDIISLQLDDYTGYALSSDSLPLTPPDLTQWQTKSFSIEGGRYPFPPSGEKTLFGIGGHVETVYLIPEPATLLLLGLGAIFIRRRK
jgi:hypothetical protein